MPKFLDGQGITNLTKQYDGRYVKQSSLSTVATSGSYNDLLDKPAISQTDVYSHHVFFNISSTNFVRRYIVNQGYSNVSITIANIYSTSSTALTTSTFGTYLKNTSQYTTNMIVPSIDIWEYQVYVNETWKKINYILVSAFYVDTSSGYWRAKGRLFYDGGELTILFKSSGTASLDGDVLTVLYNNFVDNVRKV